MLRCVLVLIGACAAVFLNGCEAQAVNDNLPKQEEPVDGVALTDLQRQTLAAKQWDARVGEGAGVWVCVGEQKFRLIEHGRILWEVACSTAAKGIGSKVNSFKTPLGWHVVKEKVGEGQPLGRVFREKKVSREVWHPGDKVKEDLVLTRVLALEGEEPGANKGGDVDSYARGIYIHGTNDEANIGKPVSHGCVRLTNENAVRAYDRIAVSTPVLITE